jgi:hypothetical protein
VESAACGIAKWLAVNLNLNPHGPTVGVDVDPNLNYMPLCAKLATEGMGFGQSDDIPSYGHLQPDFLMRKGRICGRVRSQEYYEKKKLT